MRYIIIIFMLALFWCTLVSCTVYRYECFLGYGESIEVSGMDDLKISILPDSILVEVGE